ncbi:LacI family DNA-binding transcriptional regulator [Pseudokineococcus basanitobsidens]|uniref:LacI family DNA-binding transcriptional regulator n=1 Tax=Pseudokineococcus basanitobsidens TaxID=1926649 RepID=A0ABU8RKS0_9ACTN
MARSTSADVARASGVSRTTVSYVLNGRADASISAATRERVHEAARRLGYAPSAAARSLRTGRSDLVLCVLPDWPIGPVVDALLEHLTEELADRGMALLVHHGRDRRPLAELWRAVDVRAVVGLAPFAAADEAAMRRAGIDVLTTAAGAEGGPGPTAGAQERTGRLQVRHLAAAGHRTVGYAATTDPRVSAFAEQRLAGARAACVDLGLPAPSVREVDLEAPAAAAAVRAWRAEDPPVTAVAAYNDDVALAVLAGARAEGLEVPGDVAVVGVDDVPAARLAAPPLTTVAQSVDAQVAHLVARLVAHLDGDGPDGPAPPELLEVVVRSST